MFLTRPSYAQWLPPFEGYEECRAWGAVELSAALPWFLVEVQIQGKVDGPFRSTFLISRLDTFKGLIDTTRKGDTVKALLAFYPPARSHDQSWLPKEVEEVWDATLSEEGATFDLWILKTTTGEVLLEPSMSAPLEAISRGALVYRRQA